MREREARNVEADPKGEGRMLISSRGRLLGDPANPNEVITFDERADPQERVGIELFLCSSPATFSSEAGGFWDNQLKFSPKTCVRLAASFFPAATTTLTVAVN